MKFKLFYSKRPHLTPADTDCFSHGDYTCRFLFQTKRGNPVALSEHNNPDPGVPAWKVQYGFSILCFDTYTEAIEYCRSRFFDLNGKPLCDRKGE